jgi:SAM-dependent methyltransferase
MHPVRRYHWNTAEYAAAFAALLGAIGERVYVHRILRDLMARYPRGGHAIDWGAGSGDLTALLLEHFENVYAVEPNPEMRAVLARRCPQARVVPATIMTATPPAAVQVGVISHVFYHIPDHKWGAHVIHAARCLSADGVLLVVLNDPDAGPNRMLADFGAPRFDLYASLAETVRRHKEFDFAFTRSRCPVRTTSFDETLTIARFVLCDRDEDAFSALPTEDEFRAYVRANFWNEQTGTGGWPHDAVLCFVRRNALRSG